MGTYKNMAEGSSNVVSLWSAGRAASLVSGVQYLFPRNVQCLYTALSLIVESLRVASFCPFIQLSLCFQLRFLKKNNL